MSEVAPNQDRIEPAVKPRPALASGSGANQAGVIAAGVLLSRIAGLVRDSIFAHFLGDSATADAFKAGFRIPNILQNLFGEGVLSASFIPVYGKLLGEGDDETADMLAWGVGAIMTLGVTVLVAIGVLVTPYLIDVIAPGFEGDKRDLTIQIVRILFPGAGLLVMSAWFLGVLNSHHKFFVSYTAPVAWNVAMIAALLYYGPRRSQDGLAIAISWASVVGSALQIAVQVPQTLALLRKHRIDLARIAAPLRSVFNNLTPVVISRGVINLSSYIDNILASLLPTGAVAALNYGQLLYMLPISLFGYSVAASELPAMSRAAGAMPEQMSAILRARINRGLRQIAFMTVPSSAAFLILGDVIVAMIYQSGAFTRADAIYVWAVLAGSGVGLLAATMGRLYNSAFLCAVRHAHAASIRDHPRRADPGPRLSMRDTAAADARNRAEVGRRRTDGVGGRLRMGRVRAAAMGAQSTHRMDRARAILPGEVVGAGSGSRRNRLLHEAAHGRIRTAHPGARDPFNLRRTVFLRRLDARVAGAQAIHRSDHAPFFLALELIRSIVALVERPPSSGARATRPPRDSTNAWPSTSLPRQSSPLIRTSGLTARIIFSARVSSNTTT